MLSFLGGKQIKRRAGQTKRKLRVEGLERRDVMASSFTATFGGGNLNIIGSNDNDSLFITQVNGDLLVTASGRINGGSNVRAFRGVDELYITLGGGTDSVSIGGVHIRKDLVIVTDFEGTALTVPGNTSAQDRADIVSVSNARIDGFLNVTMGGGNDSVTMTNVVTGAVFGSAFISTGTGDDNVSLGAVSVNVGNAVIDTWSGNDRVTVSSSSFAGNFYAALFDGDDQITIANSRFGALTTFNGGGGVNRKTLVRNSFAVTPVYLTI